MLSLTVSKETHFDNFRTLSAFASAWTTQDENNFWQRRRRRHFPNEIQ